MSQRLRAAVGGGAVVLCALLCGLSPHRPARALSAPLPLAAGGGSRAVALPLGFEAAIDRATSDQFVSVVAGDVDRDGDIDVIASVGSLDLIVWKNDGAGHFTRQPASSHRVAFQMQPPAPSADGGSPASDEWIQNDERASARPVPLRSIASPAPRGALFAHVSRVTPQSGLRVRSSRAPPIA